MKQLHVKNHYVPQCYLKRWADPDGKVCVYRTLVSHPNTPTWRRHSVSAIAYQRNLYTQVISGVESDHLELWFDSEFESPANEVLDKAVSHAPLSPADWLVLVKFLAAQDVRTPARLLDHLQHTKGQMQNTLNGVMNELQERIDRGETALLGSSDEVAKDIFPLKVSKHIEEGADTGLLRAETYVGRSTWIYSIKHLLTNTRKVLNSHKWTIVKPAKGYRWPTSDNPVVKLNYYGPGRYDLKGGWGVTKGNIIFPIDPEHAMFVQIGERPMAKYERLSITLTRDLISAHP